MPPGALEETVRGQSGDEDRLRVCRDVLLLHAVEELKSALRSLGQRVSGLKEDLVMRLVPFLDQGGTDDPRPRPSTRQLKYVLWLWQQRKNACEMGSGVVQGIHQLVHRRMAVRSVPSCVHW